MYVIELQSQTTAVNHNALRAYGWIKVANSQSSWKTGILKFAVNLEFGVISHDFSQLLHF